MVEMEPIYNADFRLKQKISLRKKMHRHMQASLKTSIAQISRATQKIWVAQNLGGLQPLALLPARTPMILGAFVLILTTVAWLENSSTEMVRTDSLIIGVVKYSLRDTLVLGTILPFSSKQMELVLTLELLFGRSGLSLFQNESREHLEEKDTSSEQKSLTDCLLRAVTLLRWDWYLF